MSKTYEGLTVRQAAWKIEEDEASAKRLFKRYVDVARKRAKTFERKGLTSRKGYKRLIESINEAREGFSAESLSHLSFTLASGHTSYQKQKEITKKAIDTMNAQWGKWEKNKYGEPVLVEPFITEKQYEDFIDLLDLLNELQIAIYTEQTVLEAKDLINTLSQKQVKWSDVKHELLQAVDKASTSKNTFSFSDYVKEWREK